jgi:hypothetical protein
MWRPRTSGSAILCALLLGAGCVGSVGDPTGGPGGGAGGPGSGGASGAGGAGSGAGTGMGLMGAGTTDPGAGLVDMRRLTMVEYNNTVRDLLKDPSAPLHIGVIGADNFGLSTFQAGSAIGMTDAPSLMTVSDTLARTVVQQHLSDLLPGVPIPTDAASQATWAQNFVTAFGRRAYRRPVLPTEAADLLALYQTQVAAGWPFQDSIRAVVTGILMSPGFLYRWELGPQKPIVMGNLVQFNQYEMASRLSYWLWATMPDDALLAAADAGQLSTTAEIEAQVRRMLADPKAADGTMEFHTQWLNLTDLNTLSRDTMAFPLFTPNLATSMLGETRRFTTSVMQGDGRLATLLTSTNTFVDAQLAKLYGVPFTGTGAAFVPVTLDPTQRAGILTQASFLAARANPDEPNPINDGVEIVRRLLCQDLKKPDGVNIPAVAMPSPGTTIRARYDQHGTNACATACHAIIDPPGFAFLNYDAIGAWVSQDANQPVDATGSFPVGSTTVTFKNAVDMMKQLAQRPEVSDCMTAMWLRYLNRRLEAPGDAQSLKTARAAFTTSSNDMREMLVALAKTNAFSVRLPNPGENLQ